MDHLIKREALGDKEEKSVGLTETQKNGDFRNFPLSEETIANLKSKEIQYLFPIQVNTFLPIYEKKDLIGRDRTGSGKTLAFALPLVERLRKKGKYFTNKRGQKPFVLVVVPTRELAIQVGGQFERIKNSPDEYRVTLAYGQTEMRLQLDKFRNGTEIVVGTPGRIIDLIERKALSLVKLKALVLDETDQMLNQGFQEDIEKILKSIREELLDNKKSIDKLQYLLFSATIPDWVLKISSKFMKKNYVKIDMIGHSDNKTSKTVEHLAIFFQNEEMKIKAVGDILSVYGGAHCRSLIFTEKKTEANEIKLKGQLKVECQVMHGDIPQSQREVTFESFRKGNLLCVVATNVAARGLDIPQIDLIIQMSPPKDYESYIHRSGRTGRAGKSGVCITLYTRREQGLINLIEAKAKIKFKMVGSPQPSDILKANARDIFTSLSTVSPSVLPNFDEVLKDIIAVYTPEEALARSLALITGYTKGMQQRSLLSSKEGYITYEIHVNQEARTTSYFWNIFKKYFSTNINDSICNIKLLTNHRGAVFDIKEEHKTIFEEVSETLRKNDIEIKIATKLPEIEEQNFQDRGSSRSRFESSRNNYRDSGNRDSGNKDESKLYISNLAYDVKEEDLRSLVKKEGFNPGDVYIVKNQDRTSRGFGYVKFDSTKDAKNAKSALDRANLKGRSIRIEFADLKN